MTTPYRELGDPGLGKPWQLTTEFVINLIASHKPKDVVIRLSVRDWNMVYCSEAGYAFSINSPDARVQKYDSISFLGARLISDPSLRPNDYQIEINGNNENQF